MCQTSALPLSFIHTHTESEPPSSAIISAMNFTFVSSWSYREFDKIKIEKNCKDLFWKTFLMLRAIRRKAEEIFEKCTIMQFWHCGFCLPYENKTPRPSTNAQSLSLLGASDLELEKSTICVCTAACFRPNIFHVFAWSFTKRTKIT